MSKYVFLFISILIIFFITLMDYSTGSEFTVRGFYLLPVILSAWKTDVKFSYFVAVFAALSVAMAGIIEGNYASTFLYGWDLSLDAINFAVVAFLVLKIKSMYENEKMLAKTDFLTGAINPNGFSEILDAEINRAKRNKLPLSLAYINFDNFKSVNDDMGHKEGNKLLAIVAETIQKNIRKTDFLSRLGEDEFALLLTDTNPENSLSVINKLNNMLLYKMNKNSYPVTFSIGLASFMVPPDSGDMLLQTADVLMYDVKSSTRNAVKQKVFEDKTVLTNLNC